MDSIGAALRQEREARNFSIEEVSESTKITVHNLAAIEEDRFEFFPNRVYARAFLRDYANFLGLDSAALLDRYEKERAGVQELAVAVPVAPKRGWRAVGYAALVVVILAGMAGLGFVGWRLHEESVEIARPVPSRHRTVKVEPMGPPAPTPPKPVPPTQPAQPAPSGPLTIKLTALGNVWVSVKVDGQTKLFQTIPAGTTQRFEGQKKIQIRAGRANAVQIERNGKSAVLGPQSMPVTKVFVMPKAVTPGARQ